MPNIKIKKVVGATVILLSFSLKSYVVFSKQENNLIHQQSIEVNNQLSLESYIAKYAGQYKQICPNIRIDNSLLDSLSVFDTHHQSVCRLASKTTRFKSVNYTITNVEDISNTERKLSAELKNKNLNRDANQINSVVKPTEITNAIKILEPLNSLTHLNVLKVVHDRLDNVFGKFKNIKSNYIFQPKSVSDINVKNNIASTDQKSNYFSNKHSVCTNHYGSNGGLNNYDLNRTVCVDHFREKNLAEKLGVVENYNSLTNKLLSFNTSKSMVESELGDRLGKDDKKYTVCSYSKEKGKLTVNEKHRTVCIARFDRKSDNYRHGKAKEEGLVVQLVKLAQNDKQESKKDTVAKTPKIEKDTKVKIHIKNEELDTGKQVSETRSAHVMKTTNHEEASKPKTTKVTIIHYNLDANSQEQLNIKREQSETSGDSDDNNSLELLKQRLEELHEIINDENN